MSLLWTGIAFFLYFEMAVTFLLCLPFLSGKIWRWLMQWKMVSEATWRIVFYVCLVVLTAVFLESIRGIVKYGDVSKGGQGTNYNMELARMKDLFRAQRNFYISGFSLFLILVIQRLLKLHVEKADLEDQQKKTK